MLNDECGYRQRPSQLPIEHSQRSATSKSICWAHCWAQIPKVKKDLAPCEAKSLSHMVRLAGIEPTTPWFVAKYSIQLSYSR